MSENTPPRSLLLERLESRCLLAGGSFLFSEGFSDDPQGRGEDLGRDGGSGERSRRDRPAEVRPAEVRPAEWGHMHRHERSTDQPDRHHADRGNRRGDQPVASVGQPPTVHLTFGGTPVSPQGTTPGTPSIATPFPSPITNQSTTLNGSPDSNFRGDQPNRSQPNWPQPSGNGTTNGVVFVSVTESPSRPRGVPLPGPSGSSQATVAAESNSTVEVETPETSAAETRRDERSATPKADFVVGDSATSNSTASKSAEARLDPRSTADGAEFDRSGSDESDGLFEERFSEQTESSVGGVIEALAPRILDRSIPPQPLVQNDSSDDASWKIKRETIRRLGEMEDRSVLEHPGSTDQAMQGWFGGPGGLIEIEAGDGMLPVGDAAGAIVDIPLDVILGSHRSLDLVAAASFSGSETAVRDAVLAAIAGEQADHAAPLQEQASTRFHTIAYSGAALIASTLAIASRRKQAGSLSKTRGGDSAVTHKTP